MIRRRLPGFRFEAQAPPARDTLPRMDIAVFVGFAAAGPLHCPVAVEDPATFADIFGADAPLAWDARRGERSYANLAPAVRAFLRNGGRRCWVIRVADEQWATANRIPLPGLLRVDMSPGGTFRVRPAYAYARSQGRWADMVRAATALTVQTVLLQSVRLEVPAPYVSLRSDPGLRAGDLLRLRYRDGLTAMVLIEQTQPELNSRMPAAAVLHSLGRAIWLAPVLEQSPPEDAPTATCYNASGERDVPLLEPITPLTNGMLRCTLALDRADAPPPGALLRINSSAGPIWLHTNNVTATFAGSPPASAVQISGVGMRLIDPPATLPDHVPISERLTLEVRAAGGSGDPLSLAGLDFAPAAERWWGALPNDAELFDPDLQSRRERDDLWRRAAAPRFPLAGRNPELPPDAPPDQPLFSFPLGLDAGVSSLLPAEPPAGQPLERDGLATFSRDLFLDPVLSAALTNEIMVKADFLRYLSPQPRSLRGIHAALGIDEATIIAVPDAVQQPWEPYRPADPLEPAASSPLERPHWWRQRGCAAPVTPAAEPPWGEFLDCAIALISAPVLDTPDPLPNPLGISTLRWTSDSLGAVSILEEATEADFGDAVELYRGGDTEFTVYGRPPGDYYYRVRSEAGINTSDWSAGIVLRVGEATGWVTQPALDVPARPAINTDLLAIHRALLRLCGARGDMLAVLALPEDAREDAAIAHVAALRPAATALIAGGSATLDLPLSYAEAAVLSYGALYHPWLVVREETQGIRRLAPDGAMCGMLARRALSRGAWIAPANESLRDVIALIPAIEAARRLDLLESQINLIRNEPYGFVALSADTLATDRDLVPLNVRRLLSLLRRLVVRLGAEFVFEPNDDVFRRMVRRDIESALGELFTRGAFAGRTPDSSYRVLIRDAPLDREQGTLNVDLMVAPSLPLTFLTVRLVQSGGRSTVTEER